MQCFFQTDLPEKVASSFEFQESKALLDKAVPWDILQGPDCLDSWGVHTAFFPYWNKEKKSKVNLAP